MVMNFVHINGTDILRNWRFQTVLVHACVVATWITSDFFSKCPKSHQDSQAKGRSR